MDPNAARPSSAEAGWTWPPVRARGARRGGPVRHRGVGARLQRPAPVGARRPLDAALPPLRLRPAGRPAGRAARPAARVGRPSVRSRGVSWRPCRSSWWPSSGRSGPARRRWSSPARPRASWASCPATRPLLGQLAEGGVVTIRTESGEDVIVAAHGGFLSVTERGRLHPRRDRGDLHRDRRRARPRGAAAARRARRRARGPRRRPPGPVPAAGRRRGRLSHALIPTAAHRDARDHGPARPARRRAGRRRRARSCCAGGSCSPGSARSPCGCARSGSPRWSVGVAWYGGDMLLWYRGLSLSVRPQERLSRAELQVESRRSPGRDDLALPVGRRRPDHPHRRRARASWRWTARR